MSISKQVTGREIVCCLLQLQECKHFPHSGCTDHHSRRSSPSSCSHNPYSSSVTDIHAARASSCSKTSPSVDAEAAEKENSSYDDETQSSQDSRKYDRHQVRLESRATLWSCSNSGSCRCLIMCCSTSCRCYCSAPIAGGRYSCSS